MTPSKTTVQMFQKQAVAVENLDIFLVSKRVVSTRNKPAGSGMEANGWGPGVR